MNIYIFKEIINNLSKIEMRYKKSFNRILSNELLLIFIHKKIINLSRGKEIDSN